VGRSSFGAITLLALERGGTAPAVAAVCAAIWGIGLVGWFALPVAEPSRKAQGAGEAWIAFMRELWRVVRTRNMVYGLAFAATAGAAFEALGSFLPVALEDNGYRTGDLAFLWFPVEPACTTLGAIAGGLLTDRLGFRRGVAAAHVALMSMVALVAVGTEFVPRGGVLLLAFAAAYYVAYGWFLASSYGMFMALTRPAVAATQFTAFMAMTNFCENWTAKACGSLYDGFGPKWAFLSFLPVSLAALPLLLFLRPSRQ